MACRAAHHDRQCGRRAGGISVAELIDDYVYRHHHSMFPVVDNGRLVGCSACTTSNGCRATGGPPLEIAEIMQPCSASTAVSPDTDAIEALSLMTRSQNARLLVTEGDRLVGIVRA